MSGYGLPVWSYVYGGPVGTGRVRTEPEDFVVDECLGFAPSGSGEHVFLLIEKAGENTEYVAGQLARFANVKRRDIGYAGLKDRHALTRQWFSVWLPGQKDPDWKQWETANRKVLHVTRHNKKLKKGALAKNRFHITVRDWAGSEYAAEHRLTAIKTHGLANYFGEQRFGHDGGNLEKALALFQGEKIPRERRGMYLSSARSLIFNHLLNQRVSLGTWNQAVAGDVFVFPASNACFRAVPGDAEVDRRVAANEIHPSGVLWGTGAADVTADALALEQAVVSQFPDLAQGLLDFKVERGRRALRVTVEALTWSFAGDRLHIFFVLPAGSYATSLLREVADCRQALD